MSRRRRRSHDTGGHKQGVGAKRLQQRESRLLVNASADTIATCPRPDKRRFTSKQLAKLALRRGSLSDRATLHAYRCDCGGFHIGHRQSAPTTTEVPAT